ncbi:DUF1800 domain-containing protein [Aquimarina agarilytica]|uniref:DUF1800 domain-containing protein n=1 Tax=Aquimarina agarilytica TaxID=1087449 RepID=UPI000287F640|nr:DUF1800 domain-containing protein [Aquimarina agarilytica]
MATCNTSSLLPYVPNSDKPWNKTRAQHLYRRLTYGASPGLIEAALKNNPQKIVDQFIDEAVSLGPTAAPTWAFRGKQSYDDEGLDFEEINQENLREWYTQVVDDQYNKGLQSLLTIFWHNHFVTQRSTYNCAHFMYEYYSVLQKNCFGNFKTFVSEIGLTSAMLVFLNGKDNKKKKPNENYARELYELFTLGENNGYTQGDIVETSKALTGYNDGKYCEFVTFNAKTFNDSQKNIFGRVGNWNYVDVIDILFEEKADLIATFIVTKLYRFFVSPTINESIIKELATDFAVDFEIEPLLRKLFKSEHFFDDEAIGTIIKSPYDINLNFLKVLSRSLDDDKKLQMYWQTGAAGQSFFQPVDVAGWQGDFDWINTSTLTARWQFNDSLTWQIWNKETGNREKFRAFAKEVSGGSNDVYKVVRNIVDTLLPKGLNTASDYTVATDIFMSNVPENYFTDGTWNLDFESVPWQVLLLLQHIFRVPEFQLK